MDSIIFFQQCINGLSLGSMYALIAIGYTMVYGCLRLINFAHADIMMVGAFLSFFGMNIFGLPFFTSAFFAIVLCGFLGILIDKVAYVPLRNAPRISMLITAIGVSFFLENLFNVVFGSTPRFFDAPDFFSQNIHFFGFNWTIITLMVPIVALMLLVVLLSVLYCTKQGMAIRAIAFDIHTIALMGINVNTIIALVFVIGSTLAGIGGIFYAISYPTIDPLMGVLIGLKAFSAAVLGGIGSVCGAMFGGFILGFSEVMAVAVFPDLGGYKDAFAFLLLILVLLFRPVGIMGDWRLEKSRF